MEGRRANKRATHVRSAPWGLWEGRQIRRRQGQCLVARLVMPQGEARNVQLLEREDRGRRAVHGHVRGRGGRIVQLDPTVIIVVMARLGPVQFGVLSILGQVGPRVRRRADNTVPEQSHEREDENE